MNYYFLGSILPPLSFEQVPELSFSEYDALLKLNLSKEDYQQALTLRRFYDLMNLRAYLRKEPLDPYGTMNEHEIEEAIVSGNGFPPYFYSFLEKSDFSELVSHYFKEEIKKNSGFVKDYLILERNLRTAFTAHRARKLGKDLSLELPGVEELPEESVEEIYKLDPLELQRSLYEKRFQAIEELCGLESYSLRRVLGTMMQIIIIEKWNHIGKSHVSR